MRVTFVLIPALFVMAASIRGDEPAAQKKFVSLFDGKTLDGWEGDKSVFRVEDGAIVGGSLKAALPHNEFLTFKKEFGDFELRLKVKLTGADSANGGIQIRSRRVPNGYEMSGYQADMGQHYWGSLYDESRRNKTLAAPDPAELKKMLKLNDWNDYVIRCEGRHIQLWLNGLKTVDYTEPDEKLEQKGLIGLQIHGGPASEAWYKNIELSEY
ncbi:MAG TPA: DUF1080 domain-containing protein [Pirellulales bacterium]|nr:DUF1080 domain-containing protein [Pirellulales bacterium]